MPCIHGLDETNCPTCRVLKATIPENLLYKKKIYKNELKPFNLHYKQYINEKDDFSKDLIPYKRNSEVVSINPAPKPKLLNEIPNFKNKMLSDRLKEIDVSKSDIFGISKKVSLESPEFKLENDE